VYAQKGGNLRSKEPMKIEPRPRQIIAGEDRMDNPPTASCNTSRWELPAFNIRAAISSKSQYLAATVVVLAVIAAVSAIIGELIKNVNNLSVWRNVYNFIAHISVIFFSEL
jgi:hypothetical protein